MRFSKAILLLLSTISALALAPGCSSNQSQSGACDGSATTGGMPAGSGSLTPTCDPSRTFTQPTALATNAMSVSVNGSLCTGAGASGGMYPDEICATVTICTPGCDGQCQVINDVLLDTGSYGLRLFKNIINIPLQQVSNDGGQTAVAECVGFGDGSSEWGPVQIADIQLANEPVIHNVPIMTIDLNYSCVPSKCNSDNSTPDSSPSQSSFNGILGVGLFAQDCGDDCVSDSGNGTYYSCEKGVGCGGTTVATNLQVTNPISLLGTDNNGVILKLPAVANGGVPSLDSGSIVFGIDVPGKSNTSSSGMKFLTADGEGFFGTTFQSSNDKSFIDSGSSDLAFGSVETTGISDCTAYDSTSFGGTGDEFYCPSSTLSLSATQTGADGTESNAFNFTLESAYDLLFIDRNLVFWTIGGPSCSPTATVPCPINGFFDWGLPFFFGKNIAVSLDQTSFNLGTGPGWAY